MEMKYDIVKHIATISDSGKGKYTKELNLVSYNGRKATYDLRKWVHNEDGTVIMGKGITLTTEELKALKDAINID